MKWAQISGKGTFLTYFKSFFKCLPEEHSRFLKVLTGLHSATGLHPLMSKLDSSSQTFQDERSSVALQFAQYLEILEFLTSGCLRAPLPPICHLTTVGEFECPSVPRSYVVWGFMLLVGSPRPGRSWAMGQDRGSSKPPRTMSHRGL